MLVQEVEVLKASLYAEEAEAWEVHERLGDS